MSTAYLKTRKPLSMSTRKASAIRAGVLISEMAGRANLLKAIHKIDATLDKHSAAVGKVMDRLKELEFEGYQFEGAGKLDGAFDS